MKKRVKDLWIEALLSGEYKQTQGYLRTNEGFCCLGVLCDLANKEGVGRWGKEGEEIITANRTAYPFAVSEESGSAWMLPPEVRKWAGMKSSNGSLFEESLSRANDAGHSFEDIACVIEGNWERL